MLIRSTGPSIPTSYGTGVDLPNVVTLGADASGNQVIDVSGQTLIPFSYTFFTTNVAPFVVSSSVDGQVFSPAPADVTEVVTFSQPMDTAFTTASSFDLFGNYRNVHYAAASFSWDPTGTDTHDQLRQPARRHLHADPLRQRFPEPGWHSSGQRLRGQLCRRAGHRGVPDPADTRCRPLGDLIYTGSDTHVLVRRQPTSTT